MSVTWTLRDAGGVEKTVADWGLGAVTRERVNQAPDVVSFRAENLPSDAEPLFAHGSTVRLFRDGVAWFYGRVIAVPGRASVRTEEQVYRLAGPWWYLENLVFQQTWRTTNGVDVTLVPTNKSRLVLGQKPDGTKQATGEGIAEVLAYAMARGVPLTVGSITPNAVAPYAEALDRSCAEVIRNLLRWTPDAMAFFDYTTVPFPTLAFRLRSDAAVISLPAYGAPVSGLELTPRHDLQVPAVVLKFDQTNDLDHDTFTTVTVQAAPTTATGDEFGALVMTLDLAGARATYHKQPVQTSPIPQIETSAEMIAWWKGKFAWLADFDSADVSVVAGTLAMEIEKPANYPDVLVSDLHNELVEGHVSAWMDLKAAPLLVSATLKYAGAVTDASTEVWGATNQRVVYAKVMGTNAETQTYSRLTSATEAEPVPVGLAAALFAAAGVLQYDGHLELTEEDCTGAATPGMLLNLTGGRAEWATMRTQVQRVEEKLETGETRITVGPAKHLGHAELTALLRANRNRRQSFRVSERTSGSGSGSAAKIQGGEHSPRSDSVYRPSAGGGTSAPNRPFALIDASNVSGLRVKVNVNSYLQQSLTPNDIFPVTGLDTALAVGVGDKIWLEVDFTDQAVSAASIATGAGGWSGYPAPFVYTGTYPDQTLTTTFLLIGYVVATTSNLDGKIISGGPANARVSAKLVQCVSDDVLLQNVVFNGVPGVFPFPHHAPAP